MCDELELELADRRLKRERRRGGGGEGDKVDVVVGGAEEVRKWGGMREIGMGIERMEASVKRMGRNWGDWATHPSFMLAREEGSYLGILGEERN